ncbi:MAG: hypothetical protein US43_C0001G0011 [Candidatus Levybacteria bacterium GW2011_GWA1_37_16]|nr:MAG: hypothetical protein US43_C0001G0011 [Candidatus Levybacteria bacterium GW2011_GWA1_37_16]KKQ38371.1 MAG: hypothetical protein US55_C0008G0016 [Candidatus Levybacteria bacterium GW2011_GWC2_37_7]KKQ42770.1 MAG: hypothetical protein US59_C0004G0010 [Candidatus Levybacteria bacterium GW2011_GWB1_37_8]
MNNEDREYLRFAAKTRPSTEVFERMVQILTSIGKNTDQLRTTMDTALLEASEPIQV